MKYLKDIINPTIEEIEEEIRERRELIKNMLGQLYPSILNGEIEKLIEMKYKLINRPRQNEWIDNGPKD